MAEVYQSGPRKIVEDENIKKFVTPEQKRQRKIALIVIVVIAGIAAAGYFLLVPKEKTYTLTEWDSSTVKRGDLPRIIQASGSVTIPEQINVLSPEEGYASRLFVESGDTVTAGQILAVIDVPDLEDELSDLQLELEDTQKLHTKTQAQNEIQNARSVRQIEEKKEDLADEREELAKIRKLVAINSSRESELEDQEEKVSELQDEIEEAVMQLDEDKRLQRLEIEMIELDILQLETNIARLEEDIAEATITSPMPGEILELDESLDVPGSLLGKNQELFIIANTRSAIVELEVDEEYSGILEKGQSVEMDISGTDLLGEIASIGRVAQTSSDGLGATVPVKVKPERITSAVISGATAVGEFEIDTLENILMLPRGPYLSTGSRRYMYKIDGKTARKTEVTFGESENDNIEIVDGLNEGDQVITSGYQNYIEYKTVKLERGE